MTPTVSKVLESIIGSWILDGVRSQRSTTHALIDILHHWHKALDKGQSVRILFVDYAKAFDHVDQCHPAENEDIWRSRYHSAMVDVLPV